MTDWSRQNEIQKEKQQSSLRGKCEKWQKYLQISKYLTISHYFSYPPKIEAPFAQFPSPKTNPNLSTPSSTSATFLLQI